MSETGGRQPAEPAEPAGWVGAASEPPTQSAAAAPLLRVRDLDAWYGHFQALFGIDLDVGAGEAVAVIGANGAGKSTLLRAMAGLVPLPPTARVELDGVALQGMRPSQRVRRGLSLVPEGRRLFPSLTVEENLRVAARSGSGARIDTARSAGGARIDTARSASGARIDSARGSGGTWSLDAVYELFPNVAGFRGRPAGALSGGEQQAVAIGRGLMADPRVLLLDEVSLGLAPVVVDRLYTALGTVAATGVAMLVVEQDVGAALRLAGRVHCLRAGRTVLTAAAADVTAAAVTEAYFGAPA